MIEKNSFYLHRTSTNVIMINPFESIIDEISEIKKWFHKIEPFIQHQEKQEELTKFSYISFDELAKLLRPWYSKNSLYHIINKKSFPKYKLGKKLFFKQSEIEKWIESTRQTKNDDTEMV
jgi:predicted DNA-binding transcriptional regulator AlpA